MLRQSSIFVKTAIVYLRSYSKEKLNLYSLEEQEKAIRDYATQKGYRILEVFKESNVSAKTFDRPGFKEILEYLKSNPWKAKYIIALAVGRLTTAPGGLQRLKRFFRLNGVKMIFIDQVMLRHHRKHPRKGL